MSTARGKCQGVRVTSWLRAPRGWSTQNKSCVAAERFHLQNGLEVLLWQPLTAEGLTGLEGHSKSHILVPVMRDVPSHLQGPGCLRKMSECPWVWH